MLVQYQGIHACYYTSTKIMDFMVAWSTRMLEHQHCVWRHISHSSTSRQSSLHCSYGGDGSLLSLLVLESSFPASEYSWALYCPFVFVPALSFSLNGSLGVFITFSISHDLYQPSFPSAKQAKLFSLFLYSIINHQLFIQRWCNSNTKQPQNGTDHSSHFDRETKIVSKASIQLIHKSGEKVGARGELKAASPLSVG